MPAATCNPARPKNGTLPWEALLRSNHLRTDRPPADRPSASDVTINHVRNGNWTFGDNSLSGYALRLTCSQTQSRPFPHLPYPPSFHLPGHCSGTATTHFCRETFDSPIRETTQFSNIHPDQTRFLGQWRRPRWSEPAKLQTRPTLARSTNLSSGILSSDHLTARATSRKGVDQSTTSRLHG